MWVYRIYLTGLRFFLKELTIRTATILDVGIRDVLMGRAGCDPIFSKLQENFSKISYAANKMVTTFSVTYLGSSSWSCRQDAPSQWKVLRHISGTQ